MSSSSAWFDSALTASSSWLHRVKKARSEKVSSPVVTSSQKPATTSKRTLSFTKPKSQQQKQEIVNTESETTSASSNVFVERKFETRIDEDDDESSSVLSDQFAVSRFFISNGNGTKKRQSSSNACLVRTVTSPPSSLASNVFFVPENERTVIPMKTIEQHTADKIVTSGKTVVDATSSSILLRLLSSVQTALEWTSGEDDDAFRESFRFDVLLKEAHKIVLSLEKDGSSTSPSSEHQNGWIPLRFVTEKLILKIFQNQLSVTFLDLSDVALVEQLLIDTIRKHQQVSSGQHQPSSRSGGYGPPLLTVMSRVIFTEAANQEENVINTEFPASTMSATTWFVRATRIVANYKNNNTDNNKCFSFSSSHPLSNIERNNNIHHVAPITLTQTTLARSFSPSLLAARLHKMFEGGDVIRALGILQRSALLESRAECVLTDRGRRIVCSSFEYIFRVVSAAFVTNAISSENNNNDHHDDCYYHHVVNSFYNFLMSAILEDGKDMVCKSNLLMDPFRSKPGDQIENIASNSTVKRINVTSKLQEISSLVKNEQTSVVPVIKSMSVFLTVKNGNNNADSDKTPEVIVMNVTLQDEKNTALTEEGDEKVTTSKGKKQPVKAKKPVDDEEGGKGENTIEQPVSKQLIDRYFSELSRDNNNNNKIPCVSCGLLSCPASVLSANNNNNNNTNNGFMKTSSTFPRSRRCCPLPGLKLWVLPSGLEDPVAAAKRATAVRREQLRKENEERAAKLRLEQEELRREKEEQRRRKREEDALEKKNSLMKIEQNEKNLEKARLRERKVNPSQVMVFLHDVTKYLKRIREEEKLTKNSVNQARELLWWWFDPLVTILQSLSCSIEAVSLFFSGKLPLTYEEFLIGIFSIVDETETQIQIFTVNNTNSSEVTNVHLTRASPKLAAFLNENRNLLTQNVEVATVMNSVLRSISEDQERCGRKANQLVVVRNVMYRGKLR